MAIWFNNTKARKYLLENKMVYTFRPKSKRVGEIRKLGKETLMYNGFGSKGIVYVDFIKIINDMNELEPYVNMSGFKSIQEWYKEASGNSRYLYLVRF